MKILFAHELFPPDISGGGEKLVLKLTEFLNERGHEIVVVTSGNPGIESYKNIKTERVPVNRYLMNIASLPKLWKKSKDVDIIQTSTGNMAIPSYIVAKLRGKPIAIWIHHIFGRYWRDIRGPITGRIFEFIEKIILTRDFDCFIFQNESSKKIGMSIGVPEDKIVKISPGITHENFSQTSKRKNYVLFVGNYSMDDSTIKTKGIKYLIKAAENLPETEFLLLGNFKREIERPMNVKLLKPVKHDELVKLYKEAAVLVCSSLNEGFSLVLLEGMTSGCPIVSTIDIGQKGKIVKPKDSDALSKSIKFYLGNPKLAESDGKENIEISKQYTWDNFYKKFLKLYNDLNKHRRK